MFCSKIDVKKCKDGVSLCIHKQQYLGYDTRSFILNHTPNLNLHYYV